MKPQISPIGIPPLEQGDHLTQVEFEKRYEAMAHLKKAELIEGKVYMSAALRLRNHGEPHGRKSILSGKRMKNGWTGLFYKTASMGYWVLIQMGSSRVTFSLVSG